jgi:hypothetical protein
MKTKTKKHSMSDVPSGLDPLSVERLDRLGGWAAQADRLRSLSDFVVWGGEYSRKRAEFIRYCFSFAANPEIRFQSFRLVILERCRALNVAVPANRPTQPNPGRRVALPGRSPRA